MTTPGARRVYLHVGSPKTGTTYLQEVLWNNREDLRRAGVLYPGDRPEAHFHAAMDLQGTQFQEDHFDTEVPSAWNDLVRRAREWHGTVVISHELFCTADPAEVDRALADLGFAEVHLVCTARDLARQLPAVWQEDVKNRHTLGFAEFAAGVRGDTDSPHFLSELFWARQDLPAVLAKWSRAIPPDRVHVVTVPPAGQPPEIVWRRFAELVGVNPDDYDTTVREPNRSLGVAETELVRRLNHSLDGLLDWPRYDRVVKDGVSHRTLGSRKARTPIVVPREHREWVEQQARALVDALAAANYDVVGDLRELLPSPVSEGAPGANTHPDDADDSEVLDVAVEALTAALRRIAERDSELDEFARRSVGVRRNVVQLCERNPLLTRALEVYRRTKSAGTTLLNQRGGPTGRH